MLRCVWSRFLRALPVKFGRRLVAGIRISGNDLVGDPVEQELVRKLLKKSEGVRQIQEDLRRMRQLNTTTESPSRTRQIASLQKTVEMWEKQLRELIDECERTRVPAWKIYLASR